MIIRILQFGYPKVRIQNFDDYYPCRVYLSIFILQTFVQVAFISSIIFRKNNKTPSYAQATDC